MAAVPPVAGPPPHGPGPLAGPPSWRELYKAADRCFTAPEVPYAVVSMALFTSANAPDVLLNHLERTSLESLVVLALVSDEAPDWISLLKNPRRFMGSLLHPSLLDGLMFGFSGPDGRNLAAVHIPPVAFESPAAFNVLDDPAGICAGLEALPADQTFHPYVNVGTAQMMNSTCKRSIVLPAEWYIRIAKDHAFGMSIKFFYDLFLAPLGPAEAQLYTDVFAWWKHAATRSAPGGRARSGLQLATTQLLSPELRGTRDGWAQEQVSRIFEPLHRAVLPLSSVAFQAGMDQLRSDLAAQHAIREARELVQHADREA